MALQAIANTIRIKKVLTDKDKNELLRQITEADLIICKQEEELKAHKEAVSEIIKQHKTVISDCCAKSRAGFILQNIEVNISYEGSKEIFTDLNGEVVDPSIVVPDQQMNLDDKEG